MSIKTQAVHRISRFGTHYPYFNKISFFKNLAKSIRHTLNLSNQRIERKWSLDEILTVLCYCWIRGVSIHHASEKLER
ncbi:MAG: hypothetical protein K9W44_16490 [Candidatus Lokiarchaeota archaeon]|nr:hypothetical protein [Candidatus Harpocratesius repetitus]